jgi:hypothetical protein
MRFYRHFRGWVKMVVRLNPLFSTASWWMSTLAVKFESLLELWEMSALLSQEFELFGMEMGEELMWMVELSAWEISCLVMRVGGRNRPG